MNAAVVFDNLGPYHIARLKAVSHFCRLTAVQCGRTSTEYAWQTSSAPPFPTFTLNEGGPGGDLSLPEFKTRLELSLTTAAPDVVFVPGWSTREALLSLVWCIKNRVPVVTMSASTPWDEERTIVKEMLKRKILRISSSALCAGTPQKHYLVTLGLSEDRIFFGYDSVDNEFFASESAKWKNRATALSAEPAQGLSDSQPIDQSAPYFLTVSRFVAKKNLLRLIKAFAEYRKSGESTHSEAQTARTRRPWDLVLVGNGELYGEIADEAHLLGIEVVEHAPWEVSGYEESLRTQENAGITDFPAGHARTRPRLFLPGFRQIDELPRFYSSAGAFVLPSTTEQWGLVVNEAMASGLPVLVSNRCGCSKDLVVEGENGFTFDPFDIEELAMLLTRVSSDQTDLRGFGSESVRIISEWGPDRFARGFEDAAKIAIKAPRKNKVPLMAVVLRILAEMQSSKSQ